MCQGPGIKHNCAEWFAEGFDDNLEHIRAYNVNSTPMTLTPEPDFQTVTFPVIVTAASSRFFGVSEGLIKSVYEVVMPRYSAVRLLYYDLGLTAEQRDKVSYKKYPLTVDLLPD